MYPQLRGGRVKPLLDISTVVASLVLTDSSQMIDDGFEKLPDQIMYPYAEPYDLQKHVEWETKVKTEIATTEVQFYDSSLKMMVSLPDTFIPKKDDFKECMDESKYYNDLEYKYNPVFDEKPQDKPEYLVQPKCQIELLKNNLPGQNSITQHYNNLNPLTIISPALTTKNCEATQIAPKENSKRLLPHGSETLCTAPIHETSSEESLNYKGVPLEGSLMFSYFW
uniref:Uncharacterized protein n=1 Tax=Timema poppense TaxID=170557 RepID=A0A7R9CSN2_TIMPO|nr:unnamed protein product [Timema poppensis]